jgi:HEPN domain-containing protein
MFNTGRYIYVVFFCHLALEKLLKAIVAEAQDELPPKTHNLRYLLKLARIQVTPSHKEILDTLNTASIPTRYPEDLGELKSQFPKLIVEDYLRETKALLSWLRQDPRLKS